jgi:uncharacterized membrane protein YphA (DoxX/SURF4 family)
MHELLLLLHSWVRWVAVIGGILAVVTAFSPNDPKNNRWSLIFTIGLDVQFLVGLLLLLTSNVFSTMGETMRDATARFYAVEHPTMMIVALALAHVGRVMARKAATPASARTKSLIFLGLAALLVVAMTPWPFRLDARPLFRFSL